MKKIRTLMTGAVATVLTAFARPRRWPTSRSASASRSPGRRPHSASHQERHRAVAEGDCGEKLNVIMLDDATDPTTAVKNTRKFINEDKVDIIVGSVATPVAAAMSDVAAEGQTVQLMLSPVNLPEGRGAWSFRMPQSTAVMAIPIVEHWKKVGVKTYGFLGYSDAYGEAWLKDITPLAEKAGIKQITVERFARTDTSVTGRR
jgi:branched-chain amino acid transport system substrate-binding protein